MGSSSAPAFLLWLAVVLVLLPRQQATGYSPATRRHIRSVVDSVNERYGPFVALVMAYKTESDALRSSGDFVANSAVPFVDLYGRRFLLGAVRGTPVVAVMSGQRRMNAAITIQTLIDLFDLMGIVHYGTAGSADDSLSFGAVSVPAALASINCWNWNRYNSSGGEFPDLAFGDYNTPDKGENLLGRIEFKPEEFFSVGHGMQEAFWVEPDSHWLQLAQNLKDVELEYCADNATYCLPSRPTVALGLKGASADIFLDNPAFRRYLYNKFNVSTVDEESAPIVMTAKSPGVKVIVIRGVSDLAGGEAGWSSTTLSSLASTNALKVGVRFIELIGQKKARGRASYSAGIQRKANII